MLHYLEGHRIREIAQMLGTPVGTINTRLMKARVYMRKAVSPQTALHGGIHYEKV